MAVLWSYQLTLGSNRIQMLPPAGMPNTMVCSFIAQPARTNSNPIYFGNIYVNNDGTQGIEVSPPTAGVTPDPYANSMADGTNSIDLSICYVHGTAGEKVNILAWQR